MIVIPKNPESFLDVPGFNNPIHLKHLSEYISKLKSGRILEIGCAWGGSTWAILDAIQPKVTLTTVDTFGMNHPDLKMHHYQGVSKKHSKNPSVMYGMNIYLEKNQRAVFDHFVSYHPKRKHLRKVHQTTSIEVLEDDSNWDLAYIDGLHSYENVSRELFLLKDVKMICGDDYHPTHEGCMKAIDEFREKNPDRTFYHDPFDSGSGFWSITIEE